MKTKILCIFDGFGLATESKNNAITLSKMPNFRRIMSQYYWTTLNADGSMVGQEDGLVGNSEVGHMNIGGLKLCPQLSYQITKSAENKFQPNPIIAPDQNFDPTASLQQKFEEGKNKTVHLVGLFSTGCIHSDLRHLVGAIESAGMAGAERIVLHLITDGRDSDKKSLLETWQNFVSTYKTRLEPYQKLVFLGSVGGRFWAMDRDKNMDRVLLGIFGSFILNIATGKTIETAQLDIKNFITSHFAEETYTKWVNQIQTSKKFLQDSGLSQEMQKSKQELETILENQTENPTNYTAFGNIENILQVITQKHYDNNIFDENLTPLPIEQINKNDNVWLLNFRSDRMKQVTNMLLDINKEFDLGLNILAMNDYGIARQSEYNPIFTSKPVQNTLSQTIGKLNQTQLHIAETEKYAHVTFFFNGGLEVKATGEDWQIIPSNKVSSHAEIPEMKAKEVADYILENGIGKYDYIMVNFANPDMVGHTGDIPASIQSMEFLDTQLGRLLEIVEKDNHSLVLIADHGNMEFVGEYDQEGKHLTDTEHNANPVPCIIVDQNFRISNPELETQKHKFLESVKTLTIQHNWYTDLGLVEKVLAQNNTKNITNNWLTQEDITQATKEQLPLWYAGVILMGL
jgi:2,3-bisphosphoglycerate-independent phosphoglycerate mutase